MSPDAGQTLGEFLRQEREGRGITIEQVASATKISVRLLHSLEGDQFSELPAKPFIRGFVTSYCRFINLDYQEILTRFDDFIDDKVTERPSRESGHSGYAFERREGEQSRTVLWLVMGSFVVFGGVTILVLKPKLGHKRHSPAEKLRAAHPGAAPSPPGSAAPLPPVAAGPAAPVSTPTLAPSPAASPSPESPAAERSPIPSPAPSASPSPVPSASSSPPPSPTPSPTPMESKADPLNSGLNLAVGEIKYKAIFRAMVDVRVRYKVDDRPAMRFILRKDRVLVLRAKTAIRFQVSRPDSVTLSLNGSPSKPVSAVSNYAVHHGSGTLVFPVNSTEASRDPFPGEAALKDPEPAPGGGALPKPTPSP